MIKKQKHYILFLFVIVINLLMLSACSKEGKEVSAENSSVNLQAITQATLIKIQQDDSSIQLTKEGDGWKLKDRVEKDEVASQFIDVFSSMKGDKVKEPEGIEEFLKVTADKSVLKLYKKDNKFYMKEQDQIYQIVDVPTLVKYYSPIIFSNERALPVSLDTIKQVSVQGERGHYSLSKNTTYSSVEKAPFISGWYLHDFYSHDYSVEYNKMEEILTTLSNLKVEESPETDENDRISYSGFTILAEGDKEYTLHVLKDKSDKFFVTINDEKSLYSLSRGQIELLVNQPFTMIDKFICLIMADALNEWTLEGEKQNFKISASHELNSTNDKIISNFQLNNKNVEEETFRKMYQYVAVISADEEYNGEELEGDPYLEMTYNFTSDGEVKSRTVDFILLKDNDNKVAIKENGNIDFIMDKSQLIEMLEQLEKVKK